EGQPVHLGPAGGQGGGPLRLAPAPLLPGRLPRTLEVDVERTPLHADRAEPLEPPGDEPGKGDLQVELPEAKRTDTRPGRWLGARQVTDYPPASQADRDLPHPQLQAQERVQEAGDELAGEGVREEDGGQGEGRRDSQREPEDEPPAPPRPAPRRRP